MPGEASAGGRRPRGRPLPPVQPRYWGDGAPGWPALCCVAGVGFLLGRATLLGAPAPYAYAWVAALGGADWSGAGAVGTVLGLLSMVRAVGWPAGLLGAGGLVLAFVAATRRSGAPADPALRAAAVAGVAAALGALGYDGPAAGWVELLRVALQGATAAMLAFLFSRGARPAGRWDSERSLSLVLLGLGALAGLEHLPGVAGRAALPFGAGLAVMVAAWAGGPTAGAAAGLLAGVARLVAGATGLADLAGLSAWGMMFGAAGLAAGAFRVLGRPGMALAYLATYLLLRSTQAITLEDLAAEGGAALLGAVAFGLVPRPAAGALAQWLGAGLPAAGDGYRRAPPVPAAAGAAERIGVLAQVLREVQRGMAQDRGAAPAEAPLPDALAPIVGQVVERVCSGCALYRHCWEQQYFRTYQVFSDTWGRLEEAGPLPTRVPDPALQRACHYPGEVLAAFNAVYDVHELQRQHTARLAYGRQMLADHVQTLARLLDGVVAELREGGGDAPVAAPKLRIGTGVARLAKRGSLVSGDSVLAEPLDSGRYLLALSDGMGAGRGAAVESQQAVRLLKDLLSAGYRLDAAVQSVNAALTLKQAEDWFATLDVVVVDLATGRADMVKVGAAASVHKRGPHVQRIQLETPPAGILHPLPFEAEVRSLRPGDWLVLASDGLWERGRTAPPDGHWLLELLATQEPAMPQELAEAVLARAVEGINGEPTDDMTVLVARVEAADPGPDYPGGPGSPRPKGPVPARRASGEPPGRSQPPGEGAR